MLIKDYHLLKYVLYKLFPNKHAMPRATPNPKHIASATLGEGAGDRLLLSHIGLNV